MTSILINNQLKEYNGNLSLGCIECDVEVTDSSEELVKMLKDLSSSIEMCYEVEDIAKMQNIALGRELYKKAGKSPSRYRLSSEALIRRTVQGKGIYFVNNIVDINNLISMKTGLPIGTYDLNQLNGDIELAVANEGDSYRGIGKDVLNIANLPVFKDDIGCFGSPTSDSERTKITNDTKRILMCIYSFSGVEDLRPVVEKTTHLLKEFSNASNVDVYYVE